MHAIDRLKLEKKIRESHRQCPGGRMCGCCCSGCDCGCRDECPKFASVIRQEMERGEET